MLVRNGFRLWEAAETRISVRYSSPCRGLPFAPGSELTGVLSSGRHHLRDSEPSGRVLGPFTREDTPRPSANCTPMYLRRPLVGGSLALPPEAAPLEKKGGYQARRGGWGGMKGTRGDDMICSFGPRPRSSAETKASSVVCESAIFACWRPDLVAGPGR